MDRPALQPFPASWPFRRVASVRLAPKPAMAADNEEQQEATTPLPIDDGIQYAPILFLVLVVVCAQLNCIIERHRFGSSDENARRSA